MRRLEHVRTHGTRAALAAGALLLAAPSAEALLCQPVLGCSCTVTAPDLVFGTVDPVAGLAVTATADVAVSCTGVIDVLPSVTAAFGPGLHGTTAARQMQAAGGHRLEYNIYNSALHTTILGSGSGGYPRLTISGGLVVLGGWTTTGRIYGRIPAQPTARAGAYADTILVQIDW